MTVKKYVAEESRQTYCWWTKWEQMIDPNYIGAGFMQCGELMNTILWVPLLLDSVYTDFQRFEYEIIKDSNRCLIDKYYYKRKCLYKAATLWSPGQPSHIKVHLLCIFFKFWALFIY